MFRIVARSALRFSRALPKVAVSLQTQPRFNFSNSLEVSSKLKKAVQDEIAHEESNVEDLSQFENFFKNQGWSIQYHGIQIELVKKNGPYDLRVLFNARTPIPADENNEQQQQEEMQEENSDYSDVTVYIKKDGAAKWLYCEFMITGNSEAHLGLATFINDYESERAERAKGRVPPIGYTGPELSTLEQNFQDSIYQFIEGVGVSGEILQRAAQFSVAYEHQFYIEWLKDFKSLV